MARNFTETIKAQVRDRANGLCEYCHAVEKWQFVQFTIDHVLPKSQGGTDNLDNLALASIAIARSTQKVLPAIPKQK